ncbi:MAG: hypothetical protein ACW98F_07290 [Candidatus Hodarchaeales archaeon]|jgi:hypothetical protein
MKIKNHLEKIKHLESSLAKLGEDTDAEAIIELIMIITAHYVNAAMHKLNTLRIEKDEKYNKMHRVLVKEKRLAEDSWAIWNALDRIEKLRPKHVYGKGSNGEAIKEVKTHYEKIKTVCRRILNV